MPNILGFFAGGWMRWAVLAAAVAIGVFMLRMHWVQQGREAVLRENVQVAQKIIHKQGEVTTKVVKQYIKVAGKTQVVTERIENEVIKYAEANPGVCLDPDWRRLHDDAAANTVPKGVK